MISLGAESALPKGEPVAMPAESVTPAASATESAPEPSDAKAPPPNAVGVVPKDGAPVEPAQYQPNLKFKVRQQEMEFDEWAKGAIKDSDTEKKVRELYEKAYGLDHVKEERERIRGEYETVKARDAETQKAIEALASHVKAKDYDSFFDSLGIPKEDIMRYAVEVVRREQMPPEQRQQWEASRQAQQQAKYYQEQNQTLQEQQRQFQVQQTQFQLQTEISKPEISSIANVYNANRGDPAAFESYVISIGQMHAARGNDIPVAQAVAEAIQHLKAANPQLGVMQNAAPQSNVVTPSNKPTLPNIQGRGVSAIKSAPKSLEDLRALAREAASR